MKRNNKNKLKMNYYSMPLLFSFFIMISCTTSETQTVANFTNPVMLQEFNEDGAPDSNIWGYNIGTGTNGWGNNELQY